jgi:hypothetical protein
MKTWLTLLGIITGVLGVLTLVCFVITIAWQDLMVEVWGLPPIDFWNAACLLFFITLVKPAVSVKRD